MKQQKSVSMGQVVLIAIVVSLITSLVVLVLGASLTGNATIGKLNTTSNNTSVNTTISPTRALGNGTFNVVTANEFRGKLIDPSLTTSVKPIIFSFGVISEENGVARVSIKSLTENWEMRDLRKGDSFVYQNYNFSIASINKTTNTIILDPQRRFVALKDTTSVISYNKTSDSSVYIMHY